MASRAVHWHEGMFLRPQHFQAAQRHESEQRSRGDKWDLHYNWGLRSVDINQTALANHRLVVGSLKARLRDGTLVSLPEDATPPELDLREPLQRDRALMVYLAVPVLRTGRANVADDGVAGAARYALDTQEVEDENTGQSPQPLQMRRLHVELLLSTRAEHPGYEVLPIARITKSADVDAPPQVDRDYIPPLLTCDAWHALQVDILQYIYDRVGTKINLLAGQMISRGIGIEGNAAEDIRIVSQLRALNEAYTLLNVLAFAEGIHPLPAYTELCRLVGQLAIFKDPRRPPDLPRYDHDNLGGCFWRVKDYIDTYLNEFIEPDYVKRPFEGFGLRMEVGLETEWVERAWPMFVGVEHGSLPANKCISLLTEAGQLNMKIGSSSRVDKLVELRLPGLRFTHRPHPPRALLERPGLTYFEVDRDAQPAEWQFVRNEYRLAIRLNERRIAGSIQGQQTVNIIGEGQNIPLSFALYVVRPSAAAASSS